MSYHIEDICFGAEGKEERIKFSCQDSQYSEKNCKKFIKKMKEHYSIWDNTYYSTGGWETRFIHGVLKIIVRKWHCSNEIDLYFQFTYWDKHYPSKTLDFLPEIAKVSKEFCDIMEIKSDKEQDC